MKTAFSRILATLVCVTYFFAGISLDAQTLRLPDSALRFVYAAPNSVSPVAVYKTTYRYDSALRMADSTLYRFNAANLAWALKKTVSTSYNAASQPIQVLQEIYDSLAPSFPNPYYLRDILQYNELGQLTRKTTWMKLFSSWAPQDDYYYSPFGNPADSITTLMYYFSMWGPTLHKKVSETFAPSLNTTTSFRPESDSLGVTWVVESRDSVFLSPTGLPLAERQWDWVPVQGQMVCTHISEWAYNSNATIRQVHSLAFAGDTLSTTHYTYYPAGGGFAANQLQQTVQQLYANNQPSAEGTKRQYTYSAALDSISTFEGGKLIERRHTYYSSYTIGVEPPVQQPLFVVHNNGAANPLCVSLVETNCVLRLVNVQGAATWKFQLSPKASVALPHLPAGVYVLEGHSATGTFRQKVLIP